MYVTASAASAHLHFTSLPSFFFPLDNCRFMAAAIVAEPLLELHSLATPGEPHQLSP